MDQHGPENFAILARQFGHAPKFTFSVEGFHVQHYEVAPGGWKHDAMRYFRIAVQQSGTPKMCRIIDGRPERQLRAAGQVSVSPHETAQTWSWNSSMRMTLLFIGSELLSELAEELGLSGNGRLWTPLVADDGFIRHSIKSLSDEYLRGNGVPRLLIGAAGRHIGAHLLVRYASGRESGTGKLTDLQLGRTLDYMNAHLSEDVGLPELAACADLPAHYFCRMFRKTVGMPPYRYLVQQRIEKAKDLLVVTDKGITEIAFDLGFSSHAHFASTFKRLVGQTPSIFRKVKTKDIRHLS